MPSERAVILASCRTPIGRYLGSLSGLTAVDLGVVAAKEAFRRAGVDPTQVDEAIVGNVLSAGVGQAPARQVALRAGMDPRSSALTVNMVCGSGLRAVMLAASAIAAGDSRIVLAGGIESMSNAPHLLRKGRQGWKLGDAALVDSMLSDGLTCPFEGWPMGRAAELTAEGCGLSREALDGWAAESHRRAVAAIKEGAFATEIVPVPVESKKGVTEVFHDEGPRPETTREALARLAPSFQESGVVTAGNASQLSDGAAMLVVASRAEAERIGVAPVARILASGISGGAPRDLFLAPIEAINVAVARAGLALDAIDLFEINEAFASQLLGCVQGLGIDPSKVNVHGGAIALGHPIGASGARVLVTLLHALERRKARYGVASLCLGGGNAVAVVVEREPS
jgi:acetyl-CoA C-acetyltransferase